ncbi:MULTISPECIES: chloride channel protein [Vagococcus]|uniref:Chloride channel protein n=1 Tax=Vagococcus fluvialis bH819 TaxID=1255619 RepID=A0A1X6WPD5_9ENTE|nr:MULTISPECIES: chloride channel protein [Vagococcus]SLM85526.1 Chloride channel protein [Vagococcus fluvialis bH819]HCM89494.1 voltage gated chloride channel family protein [Vagococcus sp.]
MKKNSLVIRIIFYGLILSSIIGIISFIFIFLESNISHYVWGEFLPNLPFKTTFTFIFCLIGGFLVGKLREAWGDYPETAHHTIEDLKKHRTVNYRPVFKSLSVALLILIFGAGVGPEAALLSAIVMLSIWEADKMRYLFFNQEFLLQLPPTERMKRMLHPTKYLVTFNSETAFKDEHLLTTKKNINRFFIINGLISFIILMKLTKQPSFISNMGESNWQLKEIILLIPLIILGLFSGKTYRIFQKKMKVWFSFWPDKPVHKALIGSIAIFLIGTFTPNLLFSGQVTLGDVPTQHAKFSILLLILAVIIKLVFLQICLNTGWIGGDIFPIVFSSILFGFAISQLMPTFDAIFIVATIATAMAVTILEAPIGIAIFTALFFPLHVLPIILATAIILKFAKQAITKMKTTKGIN